MFRRLPLLLVVLRDDAEAREDDRRPPRRRSGASGPSSLAAEIASNDGYLLKNYVGHGVPVLGIEPARNVADVAEEKRRSHDRRVLRQGARRRARRQGHPRRRDPREQRHGARAGHSRRPRRRACAFLKDDGVVRHRVAVRQADARPLRVRHDLPRASLLLVDHRARRRRAPRRPRDRGRRAARDPRRLGARVPASARSPRAARRGVADAPRRGAGLGREPPGAYRAFAARVGGLKEELVALLAKLKAEGKSIAAYGAAAKGSTLLNHFGIGADVIDFVADRSTHKQGRLMPGVNIPIVAPEELTKRRPRLLPAPHVELRRGDPRAAERLPRGRREVHRPDSHGAGPAVITEFVVAMPTVRGG